MIEKHAMDYSGKPVFIGDEIAVADGTIYVVKDILIIGRADTLLIVEDGKRLVPELCEYLDPIENERMQDEQQMGSR